MEELIARFPQIAEQIFEQLDNKSLTNCREVAKSWQEFVDDRNMSWVRIVNIPTTLASGIKFMNEDYDFNLKLVQKK